jgi:O-antigen/teichoic acid export membrane protein
VRGRKLEFVSRFVTPEQKPTGAKVVRNALFSAFRAFLSWPIPFLLIPFILAKIGTRGYGTWAVFFTVISLTAAIDLGIGGTLTKHVAEHYARNDFWALNRLMNASLILYSLIALILIAIINLTAHQLVPSFFKGAIVSEQELSVLCRYLSLIVGANVLILPFYSTISGLQRMDLTNILGYLNTLSSALLTVVFLQLGFGLRGLFYAYSIAAMVSLLLHGGTVYRLLPTLHLDVLDFDWQEIRHIFGFSFQIYLTQIAVAIHTQIDKLYLAVFVGVEAAGWYNIAAEAAWKLRGIPGLLLSPLMAAASELAAKGEEAKLRELYYRAHKYLALVGVPLVLYVAFASKRLVDLWLGPKMGVVALPLAVLVLVNFFNLTTGPGYLILIGRGILRPGVLAALVGLTLNTTLSLPLVYRCGLVGAVGGNSLAVIAGSVFFLRLFHKHIQSSTAKMVWRTYWKPVAYSAVLLAVLFRLTRLDRLRWEGLVVTGFLFGALYLAALVATGFFDRFDLARAESILPFRRFVKGIIPVRMLNWAARYFPILRLLRRDVPGARLILEVGSGSYGFSSFYGQTVVGCDLTFLVTPNQPILPVKCSATALPFRDGAFEAVIASDILEHVVPNQRGRVIHEAVRVGRNLVIFGFPCGPAALAVDRQLFEDYRRLGLPVPEWLQEHMQWPFPDEDAFNGVTDQWGIEGFSNERVRFHYWMMRAEMHRFGVRLFQLLLGIVPRLVELALRAADGEPSYRKIFVLTRKLGRSSAIN